VTFSSKVKNELCRVAVREDHSAAAELYGIFLFGNTFGTEGIRIVTENEAVSQRAKSLLKRVFNMSFVCSKTGRKIIKDVLEITDNEEIQTIMEHYGYDTSRTFTLHLNAAFLEEDNHRESFIRGAFLAAGSVSSPSKNYHLELVTRHYYLSREVMALLLDMGFSPKKTMRKSNYMIYFKDSESIEDFLTKSGAPSSAIALMEAKVVKDLRNRVNRIVNCETANLSKTVVAAQRQIESINKLKESGAYEGLTEKLRQSAELRLEHPHATLGELVKLAPFEVSRSGLNHRLAKLVELAEEEVE
jgi:DNA-binding protein WhiA